MRAVAVLCVLASLTGCASEPPAPPSGPGRGFPLAGPWVSYYGRSGSTDFRSMAATFRIIDVDADPVGGNVTADQITTLRDGGRNRVLSYFNVGAIEQARDYWTTVPSGFLAPHDNGKAQLGPFAGDPGEVWMDPSDSDWRKVLVDHVAPRLVAQGVDGFYFGNLDIVEHDAAPDEPLCGPRCAQAGLDLVGELRARYPRLLFVMQNATSDVTRSGRTRRGSFASLLDGVVHDAVFTTRTQSGGGNASFETYQTRTDVAAVRELATWRDQGLRPGGRPLWIATLDYVNRCDNTKDAAKIRAAAKAQRFSPSVSDRSSAQAEVCYP